MRPTYLALAIVPLCGCYPTLPPHLAEGTEVLVPGNVSVTLAGGAAGFEATSAEMGTTVGSGSGAVGGVEARVRVGVGAHQEIGASVFVGVGPPIDHGDVPFAVGGKLSYKVAPLPWLAFVADGGALLDSASAVGIGSGDLAVIVAPYTAPGGSQLYLAVRGSFAVPVLEGARDVNEAITIPIGLALHTSKRVRLFVEGGPMCGFSQLVTSSAPSSPQDTTTVGGYGILAVALLFR